MAHLVKVTPEEEAVLVRLAEQAQVSVPRLLVEAATSLPHGHTATERRDAIVDLMAVSRVLAGVATNLNQLARSVNAGAEFPPQAAVVRERIRALIPRIARACDDLRDPRNTAPLAAVPGRPGARGLGGSRGPDVEIDPAEADPTRVERVGTAVDGVAIDRDGGLVDENPVGRPGGPL